MEAQSDRTCAICKKQFTYPWQLKRHKLNKRPCVPLYNNEEKNRCALCKRLFRDTWCLQRHIAGCYTQETITSLLNRIEELEKQIKECKETRTVNITVINIIGLETRDHIPQQAIQHEMDKEMAETPLDKTHQVLIADKLFAYAARLLYDVKVAPSNLTCFMASEALHTVIIFTTDRKWESRSIKEVTPQMAQSTLDTVLIKQPFESGTYPLIEYSNIIKIMYMRADSYASSQDLLEILRTNRKYAEEHVPDKQWLLLCSSPAT